jgi:hypothetical protein
MSKCIFLLVQPVQPLRQKPTFSAKKIQDYLSSLKREAAEANLGIALGLTGPLLCVIALFYMVSGRCDFAGKWLNQPS